MASYRHQGGPLRFCVAVALVCLQPASADAADPAVTPAELSFGRAVAQANSTSGALVLFTLTSDIILTRPLPDLADFSALHLKGGCGSRRCTIDGQGRFTLPGGSIACFVTFDGLIIQSMYGGVHNGPCSVTARNVLFRNNRAPAGAVLNNRASWPLGGSSQFTSCQFVNNTATNGSGGVVESWLGLGTFLNFTNCIFKGNKALQVHGGAISSEEGPLWMYNTTFVGNSAYIGGALFVNQGQVRAKNTLFTWNSARQGGAVYMNTQSSLPNPRPAQFCNTSFANNTATGSFPGLANAYFTSGDLRRPTSVSFCPAAPSSGVLATRGVKVASTCVGCTGCDGDCNGKGACQLDPIDHNPKCKCINGYDGLSSCTACQAGYTTESNCTQCDTAYYRPTPTTCSICPGLDQAEMLMNVGNRRQDMFRVSSAIQCQKSCRATAGCYPPSTDPKCKGIKYCNAWAYIWPRKKTPAACAGQCVSYFDPYFCEVGPVTADSILGITYQLDLRPPNVCP